MTRVVQVIGSGGLLGSSVSRAVRDRGWQLLAPAFNTSTTCRADIRADLVINCSAIADRHAPRWKAVEVNALAPHMIAKACNQAGARLVHVSTDQIFEGPGPHNETSPPDAQEFMAYTRLFGETREGPHVTLRAPVIGIGYKGIVKDIVESSIDRPLIASNQVLLNCILVPILADIILDVAVSKAEGVLHVPAPHISRWGLCNAITEWLRCPSYLRRIDDVSIDRRMVSLRWEKLGLPAVPSLEDQLAVVEKPNLRQPVLR
jgi:dTDP-4-dehydrorhamnose reductase